MESSNPSYRDCVDAIVKDHQVSKRQFSFYLIDCHSESKLRDMCNKRQAELISCQFHLNREHTSQIYFGIQNEDNDHTLSQDRLVFEIEKLISNQFYSGSTQNLNKYSDDSDLADMFKHKFVGFLKYIGEDLAPKVNMLHQTFYRYKFESPLDFIMIKSDFKRFYESFTQARLSMLYSLHIHKDTVF